MARPTQVLRRRLGDGPVLMAPGAFDPMSAMLVEDAGYEAVYLTGGGFSRANGLPDMGLLSVTEVVGFVDRVCDAVSIPVIADLDNGYGNALNVRRAFRAFERAGVAGLHLEDQIVPKKCGHYDDKAVIPTAEMVGKIASATDARLDDDLVIIARTDARAVEGFDAALERLTAYLDAGADIGFLEAPLSREELRETPRREPRATVANVFEGGKTPFVEAAELSAWGFRLAIYPSQTQRSSIWAVRRTLAAMRETGSSTAVDEQMVSFAEREHAIRAADWDGLARRYAAERAG